MTNNKCKFDLASLITDETNSDLITITPDGSPLPPIKRSLDAVVDHRGADSALRETSDILDHLTAEAVSGLRDAIGVSRAEGDESFTCPDCHGALYLSTCGMVESQRLGGTRAFFKHHASDESPTCPSARDAGRHPDAVDAGRFDGQQEGARHRALKLGLAARLTADPAFHDVTVERAVVSGSARRRPDVQARLGGQRYAFEVQIATPQATTVRERERFYAEAGVVPVWIIDAEALREVLPRQGFQDILWRQHAYILALDTGCLAAEAPGQPAQVRLVTLKETPRGLRYASEEMDLAEALTIVAPAGEITRPLLGVDPVSRRVFAALKAGDRAGLQAGIDSLCRVAGLPLTAAQAETDGLPATIAVLGTLLTGRKCDASGFRDADVAAIVNNFLSTARHRVWAPLVAQAGRLSEDADRHLQRPSTARKLQAALMAVAEDPPERDPALTWQPVLSRLFPRLGDGLVPQNEITAGPAG